MSAQTMRVWKEANRERVREVEKARYMRKREEIIEKSKTYYEAHKDDPEFRAKRRRHKRNAECARRARRRSQFVEPIDAAIVLERSKGICGICGIEIVGPFHVDHVIPLSLGGVHAYANVQAAHPKCNERKHAKGGDAHNAH